MADDGEHNRSQRPLMGVIMCCTSIPPEKRSDLELVGSQMGAVSKLDLTSDVTHLIVGNTDTPKYKYVAKERPDVKCLLPEWIDAVRESWMRGGETEVEALELEYKLPTFVGLRVCITGFEDLVFRKQLEEAVNSNGGEYRKDLTKEVTHLVASKPAGHKYNAAKSWGIRVVSIEWLQQSLNRGMILDENLYDPLLSVSERGQNAWVRRSVSTSSLIKRPRENEQTQGPARKLRRTASAKFSSQNDGIWTDIVGGGFAPALAKESEWHDQQKKPIGTEDKKPDNVNSESCSPKDPVVDPQVKSLSQPDKLLNISSIAASSEKEGLFYSKSFYLHGFDTKKTAILQRHLRSHGADILQDLRDLSRTTVMGSAGHRFLLVPHTSSNDDIPSTPNQAPSITVVTDLWIERCLHKKHYVSPGANVTNTLFQHSIPGLKDLVLSSTAFEGVDLLHLSKAVKLSGAIYDEYLTPNAAALVCNGSLPTREKTRHALEWSIPVVKAEWLWDSIRLGRKQPFDRYLIHPSQRVKSSDSRDKDLSRAETSSDAAIDGRGSGTAKWRTMGMDKAPIERTLGSDQTADTPEATKVEAGSTDGTFAPREDDDAPTANQPEDQLVSRNLETASSHAFPYKPSPLHELSPNSPPKLSTSQAKLSPTKPRSSIDSQDSESLTTAISSLLAHHQRESSNPPPITSEQPHLGRRKRQLFGRVPSNLSARSNSIGLSRASSVDTLNTDGLGTPLEPVHSAGISAKVECKNSITASVLASYSKEMEEKEDEEAKQRLQSTQLGYEDPEAGAWRAKLMKKMGGKGKEVEVRVKGIGTVRDESELGAPQSVSRRTRRSGAR